MMETLKRLRKYLAEHSDEEIKKHLKESEGAGINGMTIDEFLKTLD